MLKTIDKLIDTFIAEHEIKPNAIILNLPQLRKLKIELNIPSYSKAEYRDCNIYLNQAQNEQDIRVGYIEDAFINTTIEQPELPLFSEDKTND